MSGNKSRTLVLQPRDKQFLAQLGVLRVVNREQAKLVAGFHSTTRANARLLALTRAGFLKKLKITLADGAALYTLTKAGASLTSASEHGLHQQVLSSPVGALFLEHQLAINSIFLLLKYRPLPAAGYVFERGLAFSAPLSPSAGIIPDGYFEIRHDDVLRPMFLEVDLGTEGLKDWRRKIEGYLSFALSGDFSRTFGHQQFRVLVITDSDRRLNSIRSEIVIRTEKIFWLTTLDAINRDGFWSPIWLRPDGDKKQPLLGSL